MRKLKTYCYYSNTQNSLNRAYLVKFATQLRDIADDDYIDARGLYRRKRYRNFVYHGAQAIEKYLKCILVFIEKKVPKTHDLIKLYEEVDRHTLFDLSERSRAFLNTLNGHDSVVRYDSISYRFHYDWLIELDYFVRDIRPYCVCRCVPQEVLKKHDNPKNITSGHKIKRKSVLLDGKIEKIIKRKIKNTEDARSDIVWRNFYFGTNSKKKITALSGTKSFMLCPLLRDTPKSHEYFSYLNQFYPFHYKVIEYHKNLIKPVEESRRCLELFVEFVDRELEGHPCYKQMKDLRRNTVNLTSRYEDLESHLDLYYLESFLIRQRQFLIKNELFYFKKLKKSIEKVFGVDKEFVEFFNSFGKYLNHKVDNQGFAYIKENGDDLIQDRKPLELIELFLYRGVVHSDRLTNSKSELFDGLPDYRGINDRLIIAFLPNIAINIANAMTVCRNLIKKRLPFESM